MTKATQNSKSNPKSHSTAGFDPSAMFQSFMANFSDSGIAGPNPAVGWLEMNQQWMNFLGERFKQDAALLQKLSKCKTSEEINAAQTEFYKDAAEHYQREFAEMTELGQQAIGQLTNTDKADSDHMQTKKS